MQQLKLILITLLFFQNIGCFLGDSAYQKNIYDQYYIYSDYRDEYKLLCKLAGSKSPSIPPKVILVIWTEQWIYIEQEDKQSVFCWLILATQQKLNCAQEDELIGPIQIMERDSLLDSHQISLEKGTNKLKL